MLRKWISLGVLAVLAAALGWLAWMQWGTLGAPRAELAGRYRTEEQWIAGEVVQDLAEMAARAGGRPSDARALTFSIEALPTPGGARVSFALGNSGPASHHITWRDHVWSPETYQDVARAALSAAGQRPVAAPPSESESALAALLTPVGSVMETENQRVSGRLAQSMSDPDAHEDAALLVGALAMREASGPFWDVRQLLCRMAAHLAFARALREAPAEGMSGRYARIVLARLAGRTADALERIESLEAAAAGSEAQRSWLRAMRLSITEDWRGAPEVPRTSLLERLQRFRAMRRAIDDAVAIESLAEDEEDTPDWGRIALDGQFGLAVAPFARQGADPEVEEARDLYQRVHGRALSDGDIVRALNQPPERCLTAGGPRVIGWGTWAASIQRHLCHRVVANDTYVRRTLGQEREGHVRMRAFDSRWSDLTLYPFVEAARWKHGMIVLEAFPGAIRAGVKTAARTPEQIAAPPWAFLSEVTDVAVTRRRMPEISSWFAVPVPEGTAYHAGHRMFALGVRAENPELVDTLLRRDPWSFELGHRALTTRHPRRVPLGELHRLYRPREEYDLRVLGWLAADAEPGSAERIPVLEKMCALQSDRCLALANQYVAEKRDDDAARTFRRAFENASDPLLAANHSRFLVRYMHEKGRAEEATEVARSAAATYSGRGLQTMGLLMEWRGRPEEAEPYHRQVESQYDDRRSLLGFFYRMKQADPAYEPKFSALLKEFYPKGLEKLDRSVLPSMPTDGVRISMLDAYARSFGLEDGDVIVAVDGWRVRNEAQYGAAMDLDWRPEVVLCRWRKGGYADVDVRISTRRFDFHADTYPRAEGHVHAR